MYTQHPIASLAEPSTASLQLPPRSVSMQLPVTSLTQQSAASLQPLPPPVSAPSSGSPDLALLFDQFICYATSMQATPFGQTAPAALSPASIEDSIAVTSTHLQLPSFNSASRPIQPPTATYQQLFTVRLVPSAHHRFCATFSQSAIISVNSACPVPAAATTPASANPAIMAPANPRSGTTFFLGTAAFDATAGS